MSEHACKSRSHPKPAPKHPVRGRPAGDHEAKRKALLEAAAAVIMRDGYAKASVRSVAQHIGQSTGAVTYYFSSKEELIVALIENVFDRIDMLLEPVRESSDVRELFASWMAMARDEPDFWLVISELFALGRHDPVYAEVIARRYSQYRELHTKILEGGQKRGVVRSDIPAKWLTEQLCAMGDGWMLLRPVEPNRFEFDRVKAMIDAVCALISPVQNA